jgi:hypothetical protein
LITRLYVKGAALARGRFQYDDGALNSSVSELRSSRGWSSSHLPPFGRLDIVLCGILPRSLAARSVLRPLSLRHFLMEKLGRVSYFCRDSGGDWSPGAGAFGRRCFGRRLGTLGSDLGILSGAALVGTWSILGGPKAF